jgi:hypothetical protein
MSYFNKTYEDCLNFIEDNLGIQLRCWQKEVLRTIYENNPFYYRPASGVGITTLEEAVLLLEEFKKENKQ